MSLSTSHLTKARLFGVAMIAAVSFSGCAYKEEFARGEFNSVTQHLPR